MDNVLAVGMKILDEIIPIEFEILPEDTVDIEVITEDSPLNMSLTHEDLTFDFDVVCETIPLDMTVMETKGLGGKLPYYDGDYTVTPRKVEQVLATKNKSMYGNVTVLEIPYAEVTNPSGGLTATIGIE